MGFFALVVEGDEPSYQISDCHINLWSLPGFARSPLLLDVGLLLRTSSPVSQLHVALPFGTRDDALTDLSRHILNPAIADLIFGSPIQFDIANSTITYGSEEARVQAISTNDAQRIAAKSGRFHSYWTMNLNAPSADETIYIRIRFAVSGAGREWNQSASPLWAQTLLVDFRVADVREASGATGWETLKDQIVPIDKVA